MPLKAAAAPAFWDIIRVSSTLPAPYIKGNLAGIAKMDWEVTLGACPFIQAFQSLNGTVWKMKTVFGGASIKAASNFKKGKPYRNAEKPVVVIF